MSRIQTVDWNQGPVERLFGLANVTVTTASAAGALSVAGLDRRTAEQLVAELTEKADAVAGRRHVSGPRGRTWQRLDRRMLLVHPVREVLRFMPVLIGVVVFGSASGGSSPCAGSCWACWCRWRSGVLRYLTTAYRIHDGRVELRRGLLQRHLLAARLDRVRTVDTSASLIQRVLDLATVRIGTGASEQDLDLDGLRAGPARELRAQLLRESAAAPTDETPEPEPEAAPARPVLRLDPTWSRYAPLTSTGLAIAGALLAALSQLRLRIDADDLAVAGVAVVVARAAGAGGRGLGAGGRRLPGGQLGADPDPRARQLAPAPWTDHHPRDQRRRRASGRGLHRPAAQPAPGRRRPALAASSRACRARASRRWSWCPPAPRAVVVGVAGEVLGDHAPAAASLRPPRPRRRTPPLGAGPDARAGRRRGRGGAWSRRPGSARGCWVSRCWHRPPARCWRWTAPARWATPCSSARLVAQSGSLTCRRDVLGVEHVIGWNLQDTWFQRRAGLTTLVATTAGGRQRVEVLDVPEARGGRARRRGHARPAGPVPRLRHLRRPGAGLDRLRGHVLQGAGGQPGRDRGARVPRRLRARGAHGRGLPPRGPLVRAPAQGRRGLRDRRARPPGARLPRPAGRSSTSPCAPAPTRSTPATGSSPRTPAWPRPAPTAGITFVGPTSEVLELTGNKARAIAAAKAAGVPTLASVEPSTDVDALVGRRRGAALPAVRQGRGRRRRARHAPRRRPGAAARGGRDLHARGRGRVRRPHGLHRAGGRGAAPHRGAGPRRRRRRRGAPLRARLLGAAPPPEGRRDRPRAQPRPRPAGADVRRRGALRPRDRLPQRRHRGVPARPRTATTSSSR